MPEKLQEFLKVTQLMAISEGGLSLCLNPKSIVLFLYSYSCRIMREWEELDAKLFGTLLLGSPDIFLYDLKNI